MGKKETGYLSLFSAFMLIIGVMDLPYGFYNLLRAVIFISSFVFVYELLNTKKTIINSDLSNLFLVLFITTGILWNPISPVYLEKSMWIPLDVLGSLLFAIYYLKQNEIFL